MTIAVKRLDYKGRTYELLSLHGDLQITVLSTARKSATRRIRNDGPTGIALRLLAGPARTWGAWDETTWEQGRNGR